MKKTIIFIILLLTLTFLYSKYIEPNKFKVREYSVISSSIPESFNGYKIVHLTDIYYLDKASFIIFPPIIANKMNAIQWSKFVIKFSNVEPKK